MPASPEPDRDHRKLGLVQWKKKKKKPTKKQKTVCKSVLSAEDLKDSGGPETLRGGMCVF